MQQRYYDPLLGRFLSVDPVTAHDSQDWRHFNRYSYAYGNPYKFLDPDGRSPPKGCGDGTCESYDRRMQAAAEAIAPAVAEFHFIAEMMSPDKIGSGASSDMALLAAPLSKEIARMAPAAKVKPVVTVEAKAAALAERAGANSVHVRTSSGLIRYDLAGDSHYSKVEGRSIPTPHVQSYKNNVITSGPRAGQVGSVTKDGDARPATMQDMRVVDQVLDRRAK
jgi:hypothetical protein